MDHLVFSIFATDQPGQVERIAECIASQGGNWLESRMARLAGQFAGIVRVEVPTQARDALLDALQTLSDHGIRVMFAEGAAESTTPWKPIGMELVGNDRPGIVRDITRLLTGQGVNVERLVTEVRPSPMSSETLFHAEAVLGVPPGLSLDSLKERLETLADELVVELVLKTDEH